MLVLDDFHRLSEPSARESVAWFVDHLPRDVQLVLATRTDPALPLGTLRARGQLLELRADELRFTARRGGRVPQRPARRSGSPPPTSSCSSRAPRAGRPGIYLAALSLARHGGQARAWCAAFDGTSAHVVDFLAERGARRPRAGAAGVHAAHVGARAALRAAVRRRPGRASGSAARAGLARAHEPLPAPARRPAPLVPLPPPVRAAPARRAGAARAGARAGAAPARVRVAPRVRHDRRGDPPRRRGRARSPRPAR